MSKEQDRTDGILHAAVALFAAHGFEGTKLSAVAKRAGVAVGTIYLRYAGKAELLGAVLSTVEDGFCGAMDGEDVWATPFPDRFALIMGHVMQFAAHEEALGPLMAMAPYAVFPSGRPGDAVRAKIASHLDDGVRRGDLRPDLDIRHAAVLAHGMVEAAMIDHMIRPIRTPDAVARDLADACRRWLCP